VPTRRPRSRPGRLHGVISDSNQPGILSFDQNIIAVRGSRGTPGDFIVPGFIDLQVNGAYGIDVMSATANDLIELSHCLAHEGTTGWLPTVITSPLRTIERCDAVIAEAIAAQRELEREAYASGRPCTGATILGMHLEGPFISPNRLGAHPALNLLPRGEALEFVSGLKTLKLITIAPELDGALGAIGELTKLGIAVSIGHTDATYTQAMAGVAAGARMFTHVFNAMPPLHHRMPGVIGAALSRATAARAALIPDGVHLDPSICQLVAAARGWQGIVITTDRVALAGTNGSPRALFGGLLEQVRIEGGAARLPGGALAGSLINMLDALRLLSHPTESNGIWPQPATLNPAAVLGLSDRGRLVDRPSYPARQGPLRADLTLLDGDLKLKAVFVEGREVD
jgi:N-acetylglucosamine-6-phosphate deacetylase